MISPSVLGHMGKIWIFWVFPKLYPPWGEGGGVNPKKYFEVTHRVQRVAHAKFGWDPSSGRQIQTNKQTDRPQGGCFLRRQGIDNQQPFCPWLISRSKASLCCSSSHSAKMTSCRSHFLRALLTGGALCYYFCPKEISFWASRKPLQKLLVDTIS